MNKPIDTSQLNHIEVTYSELLETAFNPETPDIYANYLQEKLKSHRDEAKKIDWVMESFSYQLDPKSGRLYIWG